MVEFIESREEFIKIVKDSRAVVIHFSTHVRASKNMINDALDNFSDESEFTAIGFYQIDVGKMEEVAEEQQVSDLPTVLFFKAGKKVGTVVGPEIDEILDHLIELA
ncbi:unnamed protein product [Ambrosiozyma monospora]|uniref:Unnamed protein product n=2 Tax=Ambrosiozyma monospora TaxID=43982 RepID=A0ACB5U9S6_AMBMO|nr:unnamed protein product [Ambrosiozyma monospora]GMF05197.1 unnamed protein product [Ambrosiozyma monospora]